MKKIQTLSVIVEDNKILLGMKKRGFGAGMWNGFGGKLQNGESIEQSLIRELMEESNLQVNKMEKRGVLTFVSEKGELEVHIFKVLGYTGSPEESEEMLRDFFQLQNPACKIVQHYGGGSGLLKNEIISALELNLS